MFGALGASAVPLVLDVTGPKGVPESRPLPVGKGGGASFWRAGFVGGVGALEFTGVPLAVELAFGAGAGAAAGFGASESTSIGAGPVGAATCGGGCGVSCCGCCGCC